MLNIIKLNIIFFKYIIKYLVVNISDINGVLDNTQNDLSSEKDRLSLK